MKPKRGLVLGIAAVLILISTSLVFSQEQTMEQQLTQEASPELETLWIWADVVSVDTANQKILVKYLDYDTDTEKEMNINVDDKTIYENVKSIDEIGPQDTLSIDYIINPDGSNIARNIMVEKAEGTEDLLEETSPEEPTEEPEEVTGLE